MLSIKSMERSQGIGTSSNDWSASVPSQRTHRKTPHHWGDRATTTYILAGQKNAWFVRQFLPISENRIQTDVDYIIIMNTFNLTRFQLAVCCFRHHQPSAITKSRSSPANIRTEKGYYILYSFLNVHRPILRHIIDHSCLPRNQHLLCEIA